MPKCFFKPYIGEKYEQGLVNGKKILVLGASHYCTHSKKSDNHSKKFDCPVWEICTSIVNKDSSQFDLNCEYYKKIGWYDKYDYISLSNSPRIELENYLEGDNSDYDSYKNFTDLIRDIYHFKDEKSIWDRLAFVNYVQYFLPTQRTPTLTQDDLTSFSSLLKYLDDLQPDVVIAWGTAITNHFNHNYIKHLVTKLEKRENGYFWDLEYNSNNYIIINPYHPCDLKPWCSWSKNIDSFRSALKSTL